MPPLRDTTPAGCARRYIGREPLWQPLRRFTSAQLPARLRPWLTDDGSLTARLIGLHRGEFSVRRLSQDWQVPLPSERRLLQVPQRQIALVREVALLLADTPVVFARSVFPVASLGGSLAHLRKLQNKSLGAILFQHPGMQRSPFELSHMPGDSDYLPAGLRQEQSAWGRRSRFDFGGNALLVSEVFLAPFTPWRAILPVHRSQRGRVSAAILPPTQ
ncbi:MAG: chorismate lyase [Halioglobus sp.]|nr:chorismate lyase [Halioglobus sp.]